MPRLSRMFNGDLQVEARRHQIRVPRVSSGGSANFGKRPPAGQGMRDKGVPPVVDGQRVESVAA